MAFNIDSFIELSPFKMFLTQENGADIYVGLGTDKVKTCSDDLEFVRRVLEYHWNFAADNPERLILVTDDNNTARKMAYLLAGDDKYRFTGETDDEGKLLYEGTHESEGVYMAEINLSEYERAGRSFPGSDYDLDGAIFYGNQQTDISNNLNALKSCSLSFVALIISESLWDSDIVRRLVMDYDFLFLDARNCEPDDEYYIWLLSLLGEDNDSGSDADVILQEILYPNGKSDEALKELYNRIRRIRGTDFRDEDLIHLPESWLRERLLEEKAGIDPGLMELWEEKFKHGVEHRADI